MSLKPLARSFLELEFKLKSRLLPWNRISKLDDNDSQASRVLTFWLCLSHSCSSLWQSRNLYLIKSCLEAEKNRPLGSRGPMISYQTGQPSWSYPHWPPDKYFSITCSKQIHNLSPSPRPGRGMSRPSVYSKALPAKLQRVQLRAPQ